LINIPLNLMVGIKVKAMRVTELANALSTTPDTVRYYTRIGLIVPTKSPENGYK